MIKYVPEMTSIVLEEIPGRVTLALEISNCQGNCPGCHSPFLKDDTGKELTESVLDFLIGDNFGINCVLLLGEGNDPGGIRNLARHLKSVHPELERGIYSGRSSVEDDYFELFDYVKVGPYVEALGPLNSVTTNQRMYHHRNDITEKFWNKTKH